MDTTGLVAAGDLAARVRVQVSNTGQRAAAEVVQVYVRDVESSVSRPVRELKGFGKVTLSPGESREVEIALDQRAFSYWSVRVGRWVVEAGEFASEVGRHSRDLPLTQSISVDAPSLAPPLTKDSTPAEWLADPDARALIAEEVANGQHDPASDPELVAVVGSFPMITLTAFGDMSLDEEALDRVLDRLSQPTG